MAEPAELEGDVVGERAQPICRWVSADAFERRDVEGSATKRVQYTQRSSARFRHWRRTLRL